MSRQSLWAIITVLALLCVGVAFEKYLPDGPNTIRCDIRRCS